MTTGRKSDTVLAFVLLVVFAVSFAAAIIYFLPGWLAAAVLVSFFGFCIFAGRATL